MTDAVTMPAYDWNNEDEGTPKLPIGIAFACKITRIIRAKKDGTGFADGDGNVTVTVKKRGRVDLGATTGALTVAAQQQLRRGTRSEHEVFTGAVGEVTVDTERKVAVVHDGATAGGEALGKLEQFSGTEHATGAYRGALAVYEKSFTINHTLDAGGGALVVTAHGISTPSQAQLIAHEVSWKLDQIDVTVLGECNLALIGGASTSILIDGSNIYTAAEQMGFFMGLGLTSVTCKVRLRYAR